LLELAEWLETGPAETRDPDIGRQVRALLADRDLYVGALDVRSAQLYDALAERDAARAELVVVVADRGSHRVASSRLAVRLAGATGDVERGRAEVARLEEELVGVRSECDRLRDALTNSRAAASDRKADADKIAHNLITERNQAVRDVHAVNEALRAATAELATARRDAAAAALDAAADRAEKLRWPAVKIPQLREWAGDHRAVAHVQRPAPGTPEPAPAGGEEPSDA
jgi:chromosome segregation ATPase